MDGNVSTRLKRVLVAYSASSTHVQTTLDYLTGLSRYITGEVHFVHVTHDAIMDFELDQYDVVFHNYCARWPFEGLVSAHYAEALARFTGLKILAVQDEYDRTGSLMNAISELGFDVVLTCVPPDQIERVYPRARFPDVEFVTVLTGYVPEDLGALTKFALPLKDRPMLLGYRGRDIGGRYGRLGFDKLEIGRRMREICRERGLPVDIDWTEESRIYGMGWFRFLGSCRATLGSESGSNVFDFDGSIEQRYREDSKALGRVPSYEEFLPVIGAKDAEMDIGQVSPRVFEAAALRTPMVLFEGRYSDVISPDEHYIPLAKNFSNVDEVLAKLEDIPALEAMANRAHQHLVASGAFGYPAYVGKLDELMERKLASMRRSAERAKAFTAKSARAPKEDERPFLIERPTSLPERPTYFDVKAARRECIIYRDEIARLNDVYTTEIHKLVDELARQDRVYRDEIAHLNRVYLKEIDRLRRLTLIDPQGGASPELLALLQRSRAGWLRRQVARIPFARKTFTALRSARLAPLRRWALDTPVVGSMVSWLRRAMRI